MISPRFAVFIILRYSQSTINFTPTPVKNIGLKLFFFKMRQCVASQEGNQRLGQPACILSLVFAAPHTHEEDAHIDSVQTWNTFRTCESHFSIFS